MPTILVDPRPRTFDVMLDAPTRARLAALGEVVVHEGPGRMPDEVVEAHLPEAVAIEANRGCFLLAGADVGVVGLGDLGRELLRLLSPFRCRVRAHDPWLPELAIRAAGAEPCALDELLRLSRVVFVFAAATSDNQAMLGRRELELLPDGAALLLMSRAAVADVDAVVELAAAGRLRAAIDVWPREPVPPDHPARAVDGLLLSPHRSGGMPEAFQAIGRLVVADLELVLRCLPPVACRRAERETVGRLRSRPIDGAQ